MKDTCSHPLVSAFLMSHYSTIRIHCQERFSYTSLLLLCLSRHQFCFHQFDSPAIHRVLLGNQTSVGITLRTDVAELQMIQMSYVSNSFFVLRRARTGVNWPCTGMTLGMSASRDFAPEAPHFPHLNSNPKHSLVKSCGISSEYTHFGGYTKDIYSKLYILYAT